jgi:DhnA family fructose-bisphosphate aldolase class Ia
LCVEALPIKSPKIQDEYAAESVAGVCRSAAEHGADFIKTNYTGSAESFREVTSWCPIPVMIAGGAKMDTDRDVLETIKDMLDGGGAGTWFGRNTWQRDNPTAMVRAIVRLVHGGATVDEAMEEFK